MSAWPLLLATAAGLTTVATTPRILRILPPPAGEPTSPYLPLATIRFAILTGLTAALTTATAALALPVESVPVWVVMGTIGVVAVCIDHATAWLPKLLTDLMGAGIALVLGAELLAGLVGLGDVARALTAGLVEGAVFYLVWRLGRTMGFGDVRLAAWCGVAAGLVSWSALVAGLLAGTVLPVVFGLVRRNENGTFPYGPGLLLGTLAGVVLLCR